MWVLRRIPVDETSWDQMSPWKGCLYVDQDNNGAWYATGLAKPTTFSSIEEAEDCARIIRAWGSFVGSEIQVAMYEEIFQKPLPIPIPDIVTVTTRTGVQIAQLYPSSWNWNDNDEKYDIPF